MRERQGGGAVDVAVLGYIFKETIRFPDRTIGPVLGGTAAYAAVCLGRLGVRAGIVSNIGEDTPASLLEPLVDSGVDRAGLNVRPGIHTTENVLEYDAAGAKRITYLTRAPCIAYEDIPRYYLAARIFHLCEVDFEVPLATVEMIREKCPRARISADLGGVGGAHSTPESRALHLTAENGAAFRRYLGLLHYAKASMEDCALIFRRSFDGPDAPAETLLEMGIDTVVITLGEQGSLIRTRGGERVEIPAIAPPDGVRDTTGAGDTYMSAYLSEHLATGSNTRAGYFAAASAALLIGKTGGAQSGRSPTRGQVTAVLGGFCAARGIDLGL